MSYLESLRVFVRVVELGSITAGGRDMRLSPAAASTGYRETLAWLRDGQPGGPAALAESIVISTRQLAAKQRKWFRTQLPEPKRVIDLDVATPDAATLFDA